MPYYRRVGEVPPKRHTQFRTPDGGLYAEELMGTDGFSSSSALLYHRRPPTALVAAETMIGVDGHTVYALPHDRLKDVLRKYNRLTGGR